MLLSVRDVHAYYGGSHVLNGISVEVEAGSVVAVLGRNGVGKTTLVRTVTGFVKARQGEITFQGRRLNGLAPERIAKLGVAVVPQGRGIFPSLRVGENVLVAERRPPGASGGWDAEAARARFPIIKTRWRQPAGKMSGGEQQMLAVARALVRNADLVLLDEPSEGLAPFMVDQLAEVILELRRQGKGILLIEQKLGFALRVADRACVMSRGQVVYQGTPRELAADAGVKSRYLGV